METLEAIYQRRAVKQFDPDHRMSEKEQARLMEAAVQSPTSFNMQNWRFVLVKEPGMRLRLREASWNQPQITDASLVVVITGQLKPWADPASPAAKDIIVNFYDGKDQLQRDEAMRSCAIASQTLMLAAKAMGYDSCPMIGFDPVVVADLISLPEDHVIGLIVTIGKAVQPPAPKIKPSLDNVVITDKFA